MSTRENIRLIARAPFAILPQVIHRLTMPYKGDELHHSGWNACSSCHDDGTVKRNRFILPALNSDRIYIVDVETNEREPRLFKVNVPCPSYQEKNV